MNIASRPPRTRSFIDLRGWAADVAVAAPSGEPFLSARAYLPLAEGPISAGLIALRCGTGAVAAMPADEFIIVAAGAVTIEQDGKSVSLREGDGMILCQNAAFAWATDIDSRLIFMRHAHGLSGTGAIIPVDVTAPLEPSGAPLSELLVGPAPQCRNHTDYRSQDGEFTVGTWDSTPYQRRAMHYGHHELMYLLEGSVSFIDGQGAQRTFGKDDIFLVERGAECSWDSGVHVKKLYAIYRPV